MKTEIEITILTKAGGPLTKHISLTADGSIKRDGGACVMARGVASRLAIASAADLAEVIDGLTTNQALALGALRAGLPDEVKVVTKAKLNGARPDVIARSSIDIVYRKEHRRSRCSISTAKACRPRSPPGSMSSAASGRRC